MSNTLQKNTKFSAENRFFELSTLLYGAEDGESEFDSLFPPPDGDDWQDALSAGHTFLTSEKYAKDTPKRGAFTKPPLSLDSLPAEYGFSFDL